MSHWILLIIALNVCRISGNKYCSLESNGEPKYFICARNEYCCHFGCCVHLAFQFYQLWYYWLLLIFMFMLCSGGSWWYKFCRHSEATSSYPSLPPTFENRQNRQHVVETTTRRNRSIDRNTADNSFYFQRIWKANGMGPPPNYYTASVVRYHSASELETRRQQQECPYYQLYGPPPSYESVVRIPENGCGQPSCTLVPATVVPAVAAAATSSSSPGQHVAQQQGNILTQPPPSYIGENLPGINSYSSDTAGSHHVALVAGQHQQQQIPVPSTSIQVDFVAVPVHQQQQQHHHHHHHHQQHLPSTSTPEATCRATSPLQFRATGCRLDFGPTAATPSTATSTKTTGTATSPVLEIKEEEREEEENQNEGRLPRTPEDQV